MKIDEIIKQIQEREKKFKCWGYEDGDIHKGDWVDIGYGSGGGNVLDLNDDIFNDIPKKNKIWVEYTGLKDKNGKEIYEGNIVRDNKGAIWVITHSNGAFWRGVPSLGNRGGIMPVYLLYDGEDFEIIGNIFENPELLKGEDNEDC